MARADDQVQVWLGDLPFKVKRKLAKTIKDEADGLADAIKAAAPRKTGKLADSVKVRRKKNDLQLEVTVGGETTTVDVRSGSGVSYDYSRAVEFGTINAPAYPFFYPTYRAREDQIRKNIDDAIEEALNS